MKPIPFATNPNKKSPETPNTSSGPPPEESKEMKQEPIDPKLVQSNVVAAPMNREQPAETNMNREASEESVLNREPPETIPKENCVKIGDELIEIKPTKLKYFRNNMAASYSVLKIVPLNELLTYGKGVIDEKRDADQLLFDFLVAVFDDVSIVRDHYEDMTADDVEQILKIFGRLNHIDEKEEQQRKNREAQVKH